MLTGIVKTSAKANERRIPIYPEHLLWIDKSLRNNLYFETGYGNDYGYSDEYFAADTGGLLSRSEIFKRCEMVIIPKPVVHDLTLLSEGQVLCGWCHCVQQKDITQIAIDRKITLMAWESMHLWNSAGQKEMHIFYKNNEIAGYAGVLHVLQLLGMDGHYGPRKNIVVVGYGSVSRGAIYALQGRGFNNINVYTQRPVHLVADQNPDVYYQQIQATSNGIIAKYDNGSMRPFIDVLAEADIIINGVLQDPINPLLFVNENEINRLKGRAIIIDISCDKGMGFSFAQPTTFDRPFLNMGNNITYYSVDHIPTYLWNAASREISKALIPYLHDIMSGPVAWNKNKTIDSAIEIRNGDVKNKHILEFQNRQDLYPHRYL